MAKYFINILVLIVALAICSQGSTARVKDNALRDSSGESKLCLAKDAELAALQDELAQLKKQLESEHRGNNQLQCRKRTKDGTRSVREIRDQLEICQTNAQSKTAAIKEQAQLISQLESRADDAETVRDEVRERLKKCRATKKGQKVTENSCLPFEDSRLHMVKVPGRGAFQVACDGHIAGPGWMVIQRRLNGAVDFYRNWKDYRLGFGDLRREFFVGLENLYQLTTLQPHELYVHMEDVHNVTRFARYDNFRIGGENTDYKLHSLGEYSGNAGDAMRIDEHMKFTTHDRDNDRKLDRNCAQFTHSAWWFKSCSWSNLNGGYFNQKNEERIWWEVSYKPSTFTRLKTVVMLIRPKKLEEFDIDIEN